MVKLQVISESVQRFGGLNFIYDSKSYQKLLKLCDKELGVRCERGGGYSFGEVLNALFLSILAGGTCVENVDLMSDEFAQHPSQEAPSADTVLRTLKRLATENELITAKGSGIKYKFNRNHKLNGLLLKGSKVLGVLGDRCDFDYDNLIVKTEKQDAVWTYKNVKGYAPGVAFANGYPIYIEGRDGNAPVTLDQATTLKNAYEALKEEGIRVRRSRMDAGSYTEEVVRVVEQYSETFYIRSQRTKYYTSLVNESNWGWRKVEVYGSNGIPRSMEVRSIDEEEFIKGKKYRTILYRYEDGWAKETMFEGDYEMRYRYFSILTNDFECSEEDIVKFYNQRGAIERVFDQLNNDFNWSHIPSSDMNQNTVFMILTALLRNFYTVFVADLSASTGNMIHKRSRLKAFIFHFVTCPAQWIKKKGEDVLKLFGLTPLQQKYIKCTYAT